VHRLKQNLTVEHRENEMEHRENQKEVHHLKQNLTVEHRALQKTNKFIAALKENERKNKRRLGNNNNVPTDQLCPVVAMSDVSTYQKNIEIFCTGYAHIDLYHPGTTVGSTVNLAIMAPWDIPPNLIPELREKARYEISDDCPTPMFTPNDISLQNIDGMDLFVVQLDSTSPNGYLRKELPQCGATNNMEYKPHIPRTTIDVKIWRDHDSCCTDTKDYSVCKAIGCTSPMEPNGIQEVKDPWTNLQVGYYYKVIGTTYTASCDNKPSSTPCGSSSAHTDRRRQLLQDEYGNSGERL